MGDASQCSNRWGLMAAMLVLSGCAVRVPMSDYCGFAPSARIGQLPAAEVGVFLGVDPDKRREPYLVLSTQPRGTAGTQENPLTGETIELTPGPVALPLDSNEAACAGVDWRAYRLAPESYAAWDEFWEGGIPGEEFAIGVVSSTATRSFPIREYGLAIVEARSGGEFVRCGCYELGKEKEE